MKLQNTFYNHFAALYSLLFGALLTIIALYWFEFKEGALLIFGSFFVIDALPAIYLHCEYYIRNKGQVYEIKRSKIILHDEKIERVYHDSDLKKITFYMSPSVYKGSNFHLWAIEWYHYARIETTSGKELIISCLLAPKVEEALEPLKEVPKERKKRIFATLFWK